MALQGINQKVPLSGASGKTHAQEYGLLFSAFHGLSGRLWPESGSTKAVFDFSNDTTVLRLPFGE
jgi:hypothetical protein